MRKVSPVLVNIVVDAWVKYVVEAMTIVFFSHSGVVVLWFATPPYVLGVNGHSGVLPAGHDVRQESPLRQRDVAESCVVEAYTNCDVDDA